MKKIALVGLVAGLFLSHGLLAEPLYQKCVTCHGAQGEKVALGKSKIIKDMSKEDFIASMKGYQDGTYGGPMKAVMLGQVKGLSEADIVKIADYIVK
jgi:cytochrome c553